MAKHFWVKPLLTCGGVGYIPELPGTSASLLTVLVAWFLLETQGVLMAFVIVTAVGFYLVRYANDYFKSSDPRPVVIDEVSGMLGSLLFLPQNVNVYILAFAMFRLFDSLKPLGIRRVDQMHTPNSIMLDDLLAALYTNLTLQLISRVFIF